ncbi:MAG TPA: hypothetical protein VJ777_24090 [Mycobacterium sp.]|nr:hypothetical protein [Mycobacterium sp.]
MADHILEPAAQAIAGNTSKPPFLYEIGPDAARTVLDDVQAAPIHKPDGTRDRLVRGPAVGVNAAASTAAVEQEIHIRRKVLGQ